MGALNWHWEVRSVNGRGLDIRTRVPPGFEGLEPRIREAATKRVNRGSISITLAIKRTQGVSELRVNEKALDQILAAIDRLRERLPLSPPSAEGLLNVKGLIELVEPEESEPEAQTRTEAMLADLMAALDGMVLYRQEEGDRHTSTSQTAGRAPDGVRRFI
jgi:uncharacterized protein (TIGR00255 family)